MRSKLSAIWSKFLRVSPFGRNETERRERFERCREVLAYLEEFLQKQGAQTEQLVFEGGHDKWWYPVPNLYAELTIGDRKAAGTQIFMLYGAYRRCSGWRGEALAASAFSGQIDEGFVWGRGATDMKGSVGALDERTGRAESRQRRRRESDNRHTDYR